MNINNDLELIKPLDGLFIGQLTTSELEAFSRLVIAGLADRDYGEPAGFMGLGHVRIKANEQDHTQAP